MASTFDTYNFNGSIDNIESILSDINFNDLKECLQNEHNYLKIELHNNFQDMKTSLQKEYNYMNI